MPINRGPKLGRQIPPNLLLQAYASGVFPMARSADAPDVEWIDPDIRGVIPLWPPVFPRRIARSVRTTDLTVMPDTAFEAVMRACAAPAQGREGTWINATILDSYCRLNALGHAHSIEVWREGELVGGLYGVRIGAAFFGESMFSLVRDASKIALVHLIARLRRGGFRLLDAQFVTAHLRQFGAQEVPRDQYLDTLTDAIARSANFYELGPAGAAVSGLAVLQETTHTS
jgi:leucyl/phenylalanyl-tRNA---protein transferase